MNDPTMASRPKSYKECIVEQNYKIGIEGAAFMIFPIETTVYMIMGNGRDQTWHERSPATYNLLLEQLLSGHIM